MIKSLYIILWLFALNIPGISLCTAQQAERRVTDPELRNPLSKPLTDTSRIAHLLKTGIDLMEKNPDSGFTLCREALELSLTGSYSRGIARALHGIGCFHALRDDYDQAISSFMRAIQYAGQDTLMSRTVISCIYNIGECHYRKGAYGLAAYYYYKLFGMLSYTPKDKKTLINTYNRLAAVWSQFRMPELALYYSGLQEQLAIATRDTPALAIAWSTKGGLYLAQRIFDTSAMYYYQALSLEKKLGGRSHINNQQVINNNLALIHIQKGEPVQAISHAKEALRLMPDNNTLLGSVDARCMLGYAYASLHQYQKAEGYLQSALRDANSKGLSSSTTMIRFALANIYRYTGRYHKAMLQLYEYININDSLRGEKNAQAAGMLETKYRTAEKDRQLAEKQIELLQQKNKIQVKNTWIAGISTGAMVLSLAIIALHRTNKHRQRLQQNQIQMLRQEQELIGLKAMMNGEEQERARIARELHDGIGGMLAAIKMNMDTIWEDDRQPDHPTGVNRLMRMVEETATEVRKTAHNLMPDILTRHSLAEALQIYCEHINTAAGLQIQLRLYGSLSDLGKHIELTFYRIIQEMTQNIIKHANATEGVIEVSRTQEAINITVEDNGRGFDPATKNNGFGLQNLRYRVQALQGDISIESAQGIGTTILIEFDLTKLHHTFTT